MTSSPNQQPCCAEFAEVSRRGFLRGTLGVAGTAALTATFGSVFTETSYAATGKARHTLVVLSMRGAADGLSLVVPHADPVYYRSRPRIAVPADRLLARDGMFGLHPSLRPLLPLWNSGKMAAVQATGLPVPNRSHFSAMEEVEDADPGSAARVGWLNRLVARDRLVSPLQLVSYGGGVPSTQVMGSHPALVTSEAASVKLAGPSDATGRARRRNSMTTMWGGAGGPMGTGARGALQVVSQFAPVRNSSTTPRNGAKYQGNLGKAFQDAARTIRANVGAEVITIDQGSWDHHAWIGTPDNGVLSNMTAEFAANVAAFFTDLGTLGSRVTLVTVSEFGRRVVENANGGLDHGHGNVMFLFGSGVKGGRYYGTWPGLTQTQDADLRVTTDYRSVLSEVVRSRFGASTTKVFPRFSPERVGVMTGT